ncbi:hypothetical protein LI177_13655 [bacterium 210820-DFI.6.37]|nr:hypothetical protein [bacterium 210820-DFI.6.37]
MKRKIAGLLCVLAILAVATGLGFAETEKTPEAVKANAAVDEESLSDVNFTASLEFDAAMDDHVVLKITNYGARNMRIFSQAHYMDQIGSAGSWDCSAGEEDIIAGPKQTEYISFHMKKAVAHGDNSILAFFFQYDGHWYLGKVGENNGIEYFQQHD